MDRVIGTLDLFEISMIVSWSIWLRRMLNGNYKFTVRSL